jgi:hypothetical protein
MKKRLLFCMMLLLVGVSMQAQSVASEQMDERFNDNKLPYGWFTEGWVVDSTGVIRTEASSSGFSFDLESMMGNSKKEEPEDDPENPEEDPDDPEENKGQFNMGDLMSSLMGGDSNPNYLLTPPLVVKEGESLVFMAKKGGSDDSGSGFSISLGGQDSTFVVERSVYSRNQWVRVADFTTELDTLYKTFTISDTPAGEYRFRFRAGGTVLIDSIAGFHIDNDAPDIHIIENDKRAWHLDFSLCDKDSTRTLGVINTATGKLKLSISSADEALFSLSTKEMEVEYADTLNVDITFNVAAGKPGKNETQVTFTPADERVWGKTLNVTGILTQPGVWAEDFNSNVQPKGFFTEGWEFHDNVATAGGGGMMAMFGGGSKSFLMTPPLVVNDSTEVLLFSAKKGSSDDGMAGMGSMFGGSSSVIVEKSVYGSNKWEKVKEFTEPLDSVYKTLWIGYIEPGEYRFRIISSDSIVVDSIAGFHLDNNAPDIYVLHNNTAAGAINYGMPQANSTETLAVVNTGTGTLQVSVVSTDETVFGLSGKEFAVEASDTAKVDVTYLFDEQSLGIHQGAVTFAPLSPVLLPLTYPLTAYSTYADAWTEDFEPEYLREDETRPIDLPEEWETTGWEVKLPSSGGMMDMFSGMMGGGDSAPESWMARTSSDDYELITPRLQAMKGDVLRFQAELGGGGIMAMMSMFMGGGASGQLNVFYSLDNGESWTYYDTFLQNGYVYFVAPYSGIYKLRFTSPSAALDNFYGFRKPIEEIAFADGEDDANVEVLNANDGKTVNVNYNRVLSASDNGNGTFTPRAYTVCLPYDMALSNYVEPGKVKLYQLSFIDNYYDQFVFTNVADSIKAGQAYLAIVERGDVNLNAVSVTIKANANTENAAVVNDYEDWFFNDNMTKVGQWTGNFKAISATEADDVNMFCLLDDGSWARLTSEDNPDAKLSAFRGYYLADEVKEQAARSQTRSSKKAKVFRTLFSNVGSEGVSSGSVSGSSNMLYVADIPTPSSITDIAAPTIQTIEADGSSRYFDLQGRMLNGKPDKGIYINDGRKVMAE